MNVNGEFTIKAPREKVFGALRDARFFASCVEGVQDFSEIDATHFSATFETTVAYMKFRFKVMIELTRIEEPSDIEAKIEGTPLGIVGRLTATSRTRLREAGAETQVDYSADATLTGKLGSIGQPILKSKAKQMERQFAERLRAAFEQGAAP
jgi:carbon monoxide dehydrogenase subunit G